MFFINEPTARYLDPWNASFDARLMSLSRGARRVAYFYETPDNSTFRYRVYNMIEVLLHPGNGISAAYFCGNEVDRLREVVEMADVLVICRARYTDKLNRVVTHARNKGKRVYFDIDDLVFDLEYVHLILETLDQDLTHPGAWDHWFAYVGRLGATLRLCDAVITTNDYLAAQIRDYAHKPTHVIPNFLNQRQLEISRRIYQEKVKRGFERTEKIHLGYFSGTPTHNRDFEIVTSALARLLDEDPRIMIRVVGFMDLGPSLQRHASRIEFYGLHDFVNLQRLLGFVEVNLIPLQDNTFTNCKSELKYFEAAIVGTLSVASPVYSYARAIRDGDNGYLATTTEWLDKLMSIAYLMDAYPAMAARAFQDAEMKYAWCNQKTLIEETLFPKEMDANLSSGQISTRL